jgi:hypothetical protein
METKHSVAESFATLALGLWTVALIGYLHSGIDWATIVLIVVGSLSALFAAYFTLPINWKQESILAYFKKTNILKIIKSVGWLTVFLLFGVALVQSKVVGLIIVGLVTMIIAFVVFYVSIWRMNKK